MHKITKSVFLLSLLTCTTNAFAEPEILALLPLSGGAAKWGESIRKGIQLALESSGIKVKFEDHENKAAQAATAFEATSGTPLVGIISFGSVTSLAVAQKAQDRAISMVAIATSDAIQKDRPYVFRHMLSSNRTAELILPEIQRRLLKRIALISTTHDGMNS